MSLYTTRDIAYHLHKFKRYDKALNVLGEDHRLQSKLLGIALRELDSKEPIGLFYSFVNLPGGKMSTRAGRVVYLDNVMEMIVELAKNKLDETDLNKETKDKLYDLKQQHTQLKVYNNDKLNLINIYLKICF